jgi:predicted anti-sigma-YlaC factor YlaD
MKDEHLSGNEQLAFHAGEMALTELDRWQQHVQECSRCRESLDALAWLDATLSEWSAPEPPRDGLARVLQSIEEQQPGVGRVANLRAALVSLVGVLAGAGIIDWVGARLLALPIIEQLPLAAPVKTLAAVCVAVLAFFCVGSLLVMTLAPMLLLEGQARQGRRVGPGSARTVLQVNGWRGGSQS